jgi:triose/dihydroxyacetone kinase / FAD-AMP lyase (cyclizing)
VQSFLNSKENIVNNAIDGVIASGGGAIGRFSVDNSARVVARRDFDKTKVAIVSGGGSGHEPAHAGFVGVGMLSAAVCGEIFASPSIDAVLSAIIAVTGDAGCLLIVKNYTGDRLNFGLAAEKAKGLGYKVEMIIVADDISIKGAAQPRGVAGTLFIHKLAGFMSERGDPLDRIYDAVSSASQRLYTIAAARDNCTIPGSKKQMRLKEQEVEIGLGIHGEPGVEIANFSTPEELSASIAERLHNALPDNSGRYALMFNNLGGLSVIEALILMAGVMKTPLAEKVDIVIGPAAMMTALDMPGFSLTMFELDELAIKALRASVGPHAWPGVVDKCVMGFIDAPQIPEAAAPPSSEDPIIREIIITVAAACIDNEEGVNDLDAKVGDGDTGSTFASAGKAVLERLDTLPLADGSALLRALSKMTSQNVGGSSGVLFGILFAGAAEKFATTFNWAQSLSHGLLLMKKYGGAKIGDRTMVDALKPALDALEAGASIMAVAKKARDGAEHTATLTSANAGRSSYLNATTLQGVVDPGAAAIAHIFEALAELKCLNP